MSIKYRPFYKTMEEYREGILQNPMNYFYAPESMQTPELHEMAVSNGMRMKVLCVVGAYAEMETSAAPEDRELFRWGAGGYPMFLGLIDEPMRALTSWYQAGCPGFPMPLPKLFNWFDGLSKTRQKFLYLLVKTVRKPWDGANPAEVEDYCRANKLSGFCAFTYSGKWEHYSINRWEKTTEEEIQKSLKAPLNWFYIRR
jgi:hypothetical protein